MKTNTFTREPKGKRPIIAICYDFDKTLSPTDMQAQGYIQSVNYDVQTYGLSDGKYTGIIQAVITAEDLFAKR